MSGDDPRMRTLAAALFASCILGFAGLAGLAHPVAAAEPRASADAPRLGRLDDLDRSPDGVPLRLVLALDGIPFDLFREAQEKGCFASFGSASRMVSTFPSLSDVAFSAIGGTEPPDGYQIMRFDRETGRVVGNTMGALGGAEHAHLPADSRVHGTWHRMMGYMVSARMAMHDLNLIEEDMLASDKATFVGYLEDTDMLMHVHGHDEGLVFLERLDVSLNDLCAEVRTRTGRDLAIDIVSDHGSTMQRGRVVGVEKVLGECGFSRAKRLETDDDVAYSLAGIIGSVAITSAPGEADEIAVCLAPAEGVDLVAWQGGKNVVKVRSTDGVAEISLVSAEPETYSYRMLEGDPLALGESAGIAPDAPRPVIATFVEADLFRSTLDAERPDPLRRLWRAFHGAVKEPSDVLVSLSDGYEAGNRTVRSLARLRGRSGTHGSMTRLASLGVIASNWRDVRDVDAWSAHELLFGADTRAAFVGVDAVDPCSTRAMRRVTAESPPEVTAER